MPMLYRYFFHCLYTFKVLTLTLPNGMKLLIYRERHKQMTLAVADSYLLRLLIVVYQNKGIRSVRIFESRTGNTVVRITGSGDTHSSRLHNT